MTVGGFTTDSLRALCAPLLDRCVFAEQPETVHCAVSGGPDSTALAALSVAAGRPAVLHHVDHGLRPDSAAEVQLVAALAAQLGAEFVAHEVDVEPGPNLEERCRQARFAVLPPDVCTGHTADDQAETILANLMRGAGSRGLSALRPSNRHPIAALRRAETHALCEALGLAVVDDAMNHDNRFVRVRVRRELIPLLNDIAGRDIVGLLQRQATLLGDEATFLDGLAAQLDPTDARAIAAAPRVLAARCLHQWIARTWAVDDASGNVDARPPDHGTVGRCLAVARGEATATDVGRGWRLMRSAQILRLEPPAPDPRLGSDPHE